MDLKVWRSLSLLSSLSIKTQAYHTAFNNVKEGFNAWTVVCGLSFKSQWSVLPTIKLQKTLHAATNGSLTADEMAC